MNIDKNKRAFRLRKSQDIFEAAVKIFAGTDLDENQSIEAAEAIYSTVFQKYEDEE